MLNPGELNKKVILQQRQITQDEIGQDIETLVEYGTFWAAVKTTRSSEAVMSGNLNSLNEKRFILRYSKRLQTLIDSDKTHFTLVYKGAKYNVKSAINDDENNVTVTIVGEVVE